MLLFEPLGPAVARARPARRALGLAAAGCVLPLAIETVRYEVVRLMRAADAQDIADNLCGLPAGLLLGMVTRPLVRRTSVSPGFPLPRAVPLAPLPGPRVPAGGVTQDTYETVSFRCALP